MRMGPSEIQPLQLGEGKMRTRKKTIMEWPLEEGGPRGDGEMEGS